MSEHEDEYWPYVTQPDHPHFDVRYDHGHYGDCEPFPHEHVRTPPGDRCPTCGSHGVRLNVYTPRPLGMDVTMCTDPWHAQPTESEER